MAAACADSRGVAGIAGAAADLRGAGDCARGGAAVAGAAACAAIGSRVSSGLAALPGVKIDPEKVVTNIVIFDVAETGTAADAICAQLRERGVLASGFGSAIRMVTHYDVSRSDIEKALRELGAILTQRA